MSARFRGFARIPSGASHDEYTLETHEVYRVMLRALLRDDRLRRGPAPSLYSAASRWIRLGHTPRLRITHHLADRLRGNIGKRSLCRTYVELTRAEHDMLMNVSDWWETARFHATVVEVGLNDARRVCKVACVVPLRTPSRRVHMFICIGVDGGVKTIYLTPKFKYRDEYVVAMPGVQTINEVELASLMGD